MPPLDTSKGATDFTQSLVTGTDEYIEHFERFWLAVEWAADHIIMTDPKGVIIYANRAAEKTTGYRVEEMLGKTPALWGQQMDQEYYRTLWYTISEKKEHYLGEIRNKRKDGTVYDAEVHIAPVLTKDGAVRFYVGIERDITEAKQLQRTKTEFISLASHNLKTPLSSVRWYAEMLLAGDVGALSVGQRDYVQEILDAAKRMGTLIQRLLNASRVDLGLFKFNVEEVDICKLIHEILQDLQEQIQRKDIEVQVQTLPANCLIRTDAEMVQCVIQNLLSNAVKYNTDHGTLAVQVFELQPGSEYEGKSFTDERIMLHVEDTGMGIPAEEQAHIFEQFFRGSNAHQTQAEGTGLGLFLTREYVLKLDGDMWFTSSEKGSHFFVAFRRMTS